jgi:hypothetical protein
VTAPGARVARSWPATLTWAAAALGAAAFTAVFVRTAALEHGLFAVLAGVAAAGCAPLAVAAAWAAAAASGTARCPSCGAQLRGIARGPTGCVRCFAYFHAAAGALEPLDETTVADAPRFAAPLAEAIPLWPDGCCVCGEPAELRVRLAESVLVPCCRKQHDRPVVLRAGGGGVRIYFRSYAYQRRFVRLNANRKLDGAALEL